MDDDNADWNPAKVKSEPELSPSSVNEEGAPFTEGCHDVPIETYMEQSWAFPERTEPNLAHDLPSTSRFESSGIQDVAVKVKEEPPENMTPSPDSFVDDDDNQNSTETGPSTYHKEDFVFVNIKTEDNFVEENDTSNNEHLSLDFTEANKEVGNEGSFVDGDDQNLSEAGPSMHHKENLVFIKVKSEDTLKEENDTSSNERLSLDFTEANKEMRVKEHSMGSRQSIDTTSFTEKRFSCDQCSARFTRKHHLKNHLLTHSNETAFSCPLCSTRIKNKSNFQRHLSVVHSEEKPFSCDQCSAQFAQKSNLKEHLLIHSTEKAFSCNQCSARFTLKSILNKHLLIHSTEKAFSCDVCSARFTRKDSLNRHLVTHSNEKAFSCDQCSARFTLKSHLKQHFSVHTNEKAFSCGQCPAQFKRKATLQKHLLVHSHNPSFS